MSSGTALGGGIDSENSTLSLTICTVLFNFASTSGNDIGTGRLHEEGAGLERRAQTRMTFTSLEGVRNRADRVPGTFCPAAEFWDRYDKGEFTK